MRTRANRERQPDAVALALATITGISCKRPDQLQSKAPDRLLGDQHGGVHRAKSAKWIVRRCCVLVPQRKALVIGLESDPYRRLTLLAISVGYGIRE